MDDLISRRDAINEIESLLDKTAKSDIGIFYNKILKLAIERIQKMPSANQWIPCSKRLPEEELEESDALNSGCWARLKNAFKDIESNEKEKSYFKRG